MPNVVDDIFPIFVSIFLISWLSVYLTILAINFFSKIKIDDSYEVRKESATSRHIYNSAYNFILSRSALKHSCITADQCRDAARAMIDSGNDAGARDFYRAATTIERLTGTHIGRAAEPALNISHTLKDIRPPTYAEAPLSPHDQAAPLRA